MPTAPTKNVVVEFKRPDRLEDPTEFVADDFEDDDIQSAVEELAPICDDFRRHSFAWYYEVGKVVRHHYEALLKERTSMYGARFFNRLAQDLDRPDVDARLLANCFRLVKRYTEQEYLGHIRHAKVSPTHLLLLAGIDDRKLRDELIQLVIDEELTTPQLQAAIKEKLGDRHASKPGRPLKIPKNVKAGITHLEAQAGKFIRLNDECWFGQSFDIAGEIRDLPADKLTDEFRDQLSSAVEQCECLAATATNDVVVLREVLAEVEQRMAAQAELIARVAEEEREFEARERIELADKEIRRPGPARGRVAKQDRRIGRELRAS